LREWISHSNITSNQKTEIKQEVNVTMVINLGYQQQWL